MFIEVNNLSKSYDQSLVLKDLGFKLEKNQTLSVLGKSGGGKTTLLKAIAGLLTPDSGEILLNGDNVVSTPPERRNFVYLYQETLLFPHMNILENVGFGLKIRKLPTASIRSNVLDMLDFLQLTDHAKKRPHELSGGQRQRVAFGRALIIKPQLLLLDEPFGNLDIETREAMQKLYKRMANEFNISSVFVTHDLKEALLMGNAWGYLDKGQLAMFQSRTEFVTDPRTGILEEKSFWENLN